jgi:hypothetical protein
MTAFHRIHTVASFGEFPTGQSFSAIHDEMAELSSGVSVPHGQDNKGQYNLYAPQRRITSKTPTLHHLIRNYRCRSMLLLTSWFAPPAAREFVFCSGGRRIVFEFATALRCFAKRYVPLPLCSIDESTHS